MNTKNLLVRWLQAAVIGLLLMGLVAGGVVLGLRLDRQYGLRALDKKFEAMAVPVAVEQSTVAAPDFRAAAQKVIPSVVSIDKYEEVWSFFRTEPGIQQTGSGSGVIVSDDGYILTNNHVIEGAAQVMVHLNDGRVAQAKVVGADPYADLALLQVRERNLKPIELGTSKGLQVGQWVMAVGSPLGYDSTVSVGVVSSLGRTLPSQRGSILVDAIQTDAAINQGNSGGALTDAQGRLVGINTAIASIGGGSIGIGFAIPVDRAQRVVRDITKYGRSRYGTMGVVVDSRPGLLRRDTVRRQLSEQLGAEPPADGLLIREVIAGSVADKGGIRPFDIILDVNGRKIKDSLDFATFQLDSAPGDAATVKFWSRGQTKSVQVRLEDRYAR